MTVLAALYRDERSAERYPVSLTGTLRDPDRTPHDVVVEDLSMSGFRLPVSADLEVGTYVSLGLPRVGICPARVVRQGDERYGCAFLVPLTGAEFQAALNGKILRPVSIVPEVARTPDKPHDEAAVDLMSTGSTRPRGIVTPLAASWAAAVGAALAVMAE